jgi:metal-sulfur cluster biosynthetic enzyme
MASVNEELVRNSLRTVMDPELGANLVDLNMIRAIRIHEGQVNVDMVLTTPKCPLSKWIVQNVRQTVGRLPGVSGVDVKLLDEPWQAPVGTSW